MKPALFNTEMVRAILDGRKTVTRRVVKEPWYIEDEEVSRVSGLAMHRGTNSTHMMPYPDQLYRPGDILYVRETWGDYSECQPGGAGYYLYRADYPDGAKTDTSWDGVVYDLPRWRPSIHMPKEAARLFLRVKDVRVEQLQQMGIEEALEEGITPINRPGGCRCRFAFDGCMEEPCSNRTAYEIERHMEPFCKLWDSTVKPTDRALYGWEANPWVWVIEFERITKKEA